MKNWRLSRIKQCAKCPWKTTTNPYEIPLGYSEDLHNHLRSTIAQPDAVYDSVYDSVQAMACHESEIGKEEYCIGWIHNQLGKGNNIAMRLKSEDWFSAFLSLNFGCS